MKNGVRIDEQICINGIIEGQELDVMRFEVMCQLIMFGGEVVFVILDGLMFC